MTWRARGRLAALALAGAALLVGAVEAGLRVAGVSPADPRASAELGPGWVRDRDARLGPWLVELREDGVVPRVRLDPAHAALGMRAQSFSLERRPEEIRLFALGGAATALPPDAPGDAWPQQFQDLLRARDASHRWAVVGLGLRGLDTREMAVQAREAIAVGAQGLLVLPGEDDLGAALIDRITASTPSSWLDRSRVLRLLRRWAQPRDAARPHGPLDRDALERDLVARLVLAAQASDQALRPAAGRELEPLYAGMLADLRAGLTELAAAAASAGVPVWLGIPPLDPWIPPLLGVADPDLDPDARLKATEAVQQARALFEQGDPEAAAGRVARALAHDPSHAEACWMGGLLAWADGDDARARELLVRAADRDLRSRRIDGPRREVLRAVCTSHPEVHCLDLDAAFAPDGGLPPEDLFTESGLPSPEGGMPLIAGAFGEAVLMGAGLR
jgi:hypothetical protein